MSQSVKLYDQVVDVIANNRDLTNKELYKKFPKTHPGTLRKYRSRYLKYLAQKATREAKAKTQENKKIKKINSKPEQISFPLFCRVSSYPRYKQLYTWQQNCFDTIWPAKYSMVVVPRDHGKSILFGDLCQWALDYDGWDILYLGWTDRRKEVAEFISNYFDLYDEFDSWKSEYHFHLKNGGKFDCYLITSKETLGMHSLGAMDRFKDFTPEEFDSLKEELREYDEEFAEEIAIQYSKERNYERKLLLVIDDPIDDTFRDERHKEKTLERRYDSTIANINPDKTIFGGTRKFQEDFFDFITGKYGQKLVKYIRRTHYCTPFIWDLAPSLTREIFEAFPDAIKERLLAVVEGHPCYNPLLETADPEFIPNLPRAETYKNLLCPERWYEDEHDPGMDIEGKRSLNEKREEVGEYWWWAEYEGDPHPIIGKFKELIQYIPIQEHWNKYDLGTIDVDCAETSKVTSSFTGIIVKLRLNGTLNYHVIEDLTGHYEFEEKITIIEEAYERLRNIPNLQVVTIIEKQGGGNSIISSAKNRGFKFAGHIEEITSRGNKINRINDYLSVPIKSGQIKFLQTLRHGELIKEIKNFPNCAKFDGIDALATGVKKCEDYPVGNMGEKLEGLTMELKNRRLKTKIQRQSPIFNNPIQNPNYYKRRNVW